MSSSITHKARAKINLALHVTGQREDGYHLLDSVVVFADIGDRITVSLNPNNDSHGASGYSLTMDGPEAAQLSGEGDNLVLQAARLIAPDDAIQIALEKNLPVSSGIGGGSADAAATLSAISDLTGASLPSDDAVLGLGADVPVCLSGEPVRMRGIGEDLTPLPVLPDLAILLANPRVQVATPAIFKALKTKSNPALPDFPASGFPNASSFSDYLAQCRNDLEPPAVALEPIIKACLTALREYAPDTLIVRMSGSGATCFALFDGLASAAETASRLAKAYPDWWIKAGTISRASST
ncbi:MAG: 4-(cytidine 5'-diphospho)-2-C-methyl-D-erythritol kinase [Pseudomonadota bacterium]